MIVDGGACKGARPCLVWEPAEVDCILVHQEVMIEKAPMPNLSV